MTQPFINTTLTDERKKGQIKILEQRISGLRQKISMYEERKKKLSNNQTIGRKKRGRKPKCSTYHYNERISRYTELINDCLKNIKELETSS